MIAPRRIAELAPRALTAAKLAVAAVIAACGAPPPPPVQAGAPGAPPRVTAAVQAPAIELVETVPIETTLDQPDLRDAGEVWLEMIAGARSSIDLGQFYASNHQPSRLEPVVAALETAVARGVRVRFLAERGFVQTYPDTLERLERAGAQVRHFDVKASIGGILHAKYFVVDRREAFLGSQNFDWRALEHNYELGARIREPAVVAGLVATFDGDWARSGGEQVAQPAVEPLAVAPSGGVTLVASPQAMLPPGVAWDLPRLIELIDAATAEIAIEMLTYRADAGGAPWLELEAPIVRAAGRGVRVQIMLADWTKRPRTIAGIQRLARVPGIEIRLTTIPPWSGGFIPFARVTHAKALVVDRRRAWLGTSNWEKDYFYKSRNLGLIIEEPRLAGRIAGTFDAVWHSGYAAPVDPDATYTPPRIE